MLFEAISGVKQGDSLNHCWLIIAMIYQTDNLKLFFIHKHLQAINVNIFMHVVRRV